MDKRNNKIELNDDAVARWLTLIYAEHLIDKFCGKDVRCIGRKSNMLNEYIKSRQNDVMIYLDEIRRGKRNDTLNSFLAEELLDEDERYKPREI